MSRYALLCLALSWIVLSVVPADAQVTTTAASVNTNSTKTSSDEGLSTGWVVGIVVIVVVVVGAAVGVGVWWWYRQQGGYAQVSPGAGGTTGTTVLPGEVPVIKVRLER